MLRKLWRWIAGSRPPAFKPAAQKVPFDHELTGTWLGGVFKITVVGVAFDATNYCQVVPVLVDEIEKAIEATFDVKALPEGLQIT